MADGARRILPPNVTPPPPLLPPPASVGTSASASSKKIAKKGLHRRYPAGQSINSHLSPVPAPAAPTGVRDGGGGSRAAAKLGTAGSDLGGADSDSGVLNASWLIDVTPKRTGAELAASDASTSALLYDGRATEASLLAKYPARFSAANKAMVQQRFYGDGTAWLNGGPGKGLLRLTRWDSKKLPLPASFRAGGNLPTMEVVTSVFGYVARPGMSGWFPNFAHSRLFVAWNSHLLAQDELQVLEFPVLAAVAQGPATFYTVTPDGPTPVLIQGAPRRCAVDTVTQPSIYGNAFMRAPAARVGERVRAVSPPTPANIYAIEAPPKGRGQYDLRQISFVLGSAYSAFAAIKAVDATAPIELHVGYWGCGAYGGNRVLMVLVQLLAAQLAAIESVVIHGIPTANDAEKAVAILSGVWKSGPFNTVDDAIVWLESQRFNWGESDGN